jgi:hypothetical protein
MTVLFATLRIAPTRPQTSRTVMPQGLRGLFRPIDNYLRDSLIYP